MWAICIEASHARGLGHLFRARRLAAALQEAGDAVRILTNEDPVALGLLREWELPFATLPATSAEDWQPKLLTEHAFTGWIDDRLDTSARHAEHIRAAGLFRATFDDFGEGASLANLHVAALPRSGTAPRGSHVLAGLEYLILDPEIQRYRRQRQEVRSIVVSLGGADTYGVTGTVLRALALRDMTATVIAGPAFQHQAAIARFEGKGFVIKTAVASLAAEFWHHDLAITAGGITAVEATAAGLPAIVVATESFEVPVGEELQRLGAARFAGHSATLDDSAFALPFNLAAMSNAGLHNVPLQGLSNVVRELRRA